MWSHCRSCGDDIFERDFESAYCDACNSKQVQKELEMQRSFHFHEEKERQNPDLRVWNSKRIKGEYIICPKCNYSWFFKGKSDWATCTKCDKSFKRGNV